MYSPRRDGELTPRYLSDHVDCDCDGLEALLSDLSRSYAALAEAYDAIAVDWAKLR